MNAASNDQTNLQRSRWKPILTLAVLSPVFTELLSGNIPLWPFLNPITLFFLCTIGYGIPVLILRELAVRRRLGAHGLLMFGVAYGTYNEGLMAKTLFLPHHVPIPSFDQYGFFGGVEVPWLLCITSWHAFFAFLFPVIFVEHLYPEERLERWLSDRWLWIWSAVILALGALVFFGHGGETQPGTVPHLILIVALWVALIAGAPWVPRRALLVDGGRYAFRKTLVGFALLVGLLIFPIVLAQTNAPVVAYIGYYALAFAGTARYLWRRRGVSRISVVAFAVGAIAAMALFDLLLGMAARKPIIVFSDCGFLVFAVIATIRLSRVSASAVAAAP